MIELVDEPTALGGAAAYGLDGADRAAGLLRTTGSSPGDVLAAVVTDWFFTVPAIRVAEARAEAGRTWMYRCDYRSTAGEGLLGAAHATEIPFVFDTLDTPDAVAMLGPDAPQEVADAMHGAWVRFITDGDPGWAPYDMATRTTQRVHRRRDVDRGPPERRPAGALGGRPLTTA